MQTVRVKEVVLGEGLPKIISSLMVRDIKHLQSEAPFFKNTNLDIVEFRADFFDNIQDRYLLKQALQELREIVSDKPILFTFRTAEEGGEKCISISDYMALNRSVAESGLVDLIDLELSAGDIQVRATAEYAQQHGVKVIISSHDFTQTPSKEALMTRLDHMRTLGADISKIAVMPQSQADVLALLAATAEMIEKNPNHPLITISMSEMGMISRMAAGVFGSVATFGAVNKASAPGQLNVNDLRHSIELLGKQSHLVDLNG